MRARGTSRTRRGGRLTAAGTAKALVAVVAALYLGWWVVSLSAVNALVEDNPFLAARFAPNHPRVRIALAMAEFYVRLGRVGTAQRAGALQALDRAPLADEPFLLAAVNALANHDTVKGEALLTEARRRNPRLRMARLLLLDRYLREGRLSEATVEIAVLNRLIGGADSIFTPALASMVQNPQTAGPLIPILAHEPQMQEAVLEQLAAGGADPDLILRVARQGGRPRPDQPWQHRLLDGLVEKGDVARALSLWRDFSNVPRGTEGKGIYDGRFQGLPGPTPFNWQLSAGGAGVAERVRGAGLQVEYYGRQDDDLASQLLVLKPGRYRLRTRVGGAAQGPSSGLAWTISCLGAPGGLLKLPLNGETSAPKLFAAVFVVPGQGCGAQWVKLHGVAGDVANDQNVTISELAIGVEVAR